MSDGPKTHCMLNLLLNSIEVLNSYWLACKNEMSHFSSEPHEQKYRKYSKSLKTSAVLTCSSLVAKAKVTERTNMSVQWSAGPTWWYPCSGISMASRWSGRRSVTAEEPTTEGAEFKEKVQKPKKTQNNVLKKHHIKQSVKEDSVKLLQGQGWNYVRSI